MIDPKFLLTRCYMVLSRGVARTMGILRVSKLHYACNHSNIFHATFFSLWLFLHLFFLFPFLWCFFSKENSSYDIFILVAIYATD